jgi:sugar lactone lactonase YvrE
MLTAVSAIHDFPVVADMGPTIEGASVDKFGLFYAVNKTHLVNLSNFSTPPLLTGDDTNFFSSSRMTRSLGPLVGDANIHTIWRLNTERAKVPLFPPNPQIIEPNDMAISSDESRIYFTGFNDTANRGDLWFYDVPTNCLHNINLSKFKVKFFRINGIELSPDDTQLFISSAKNNVNGSVAAAKLVRFEIDQNTGFPQNPVDAIDLYQTLIKKGLDPLSAAMDPDGMRTDLKGNLFISLNSFQAVLKWNIHNPADSSVVINLETVKFPSNLELAGTQGKDLYVIGQCEDGESACIDHYSHDTTGKAFFNLNKK